LFLYIDCHWIIVERILNITRNGCGEETECAPCA